MSANIIGPRRGDHRIPTRISSICTQIIGHKRTDIIGKTVDNYSV